MAQIQDALNQLLAQTDLYSIVLPFVLVFAILYGLLSKLQLFGEKSDSVNAVISIALSMYVAVNAPVTGFTQSFIGMFGSISMVLVVIMMGLIGAALFGVKPGEGSDRVWGSLAAVTGLGLVLLAGLYWDALGVIFPNGSPVGAIGVTVPAVDMVTAGVLLLAAGGIAYPVVGKSGSSGGEA